MTTLHVTQLGAYESVTQPVEAEVTFLMYLYRVPLVACENKRRKNAGRVKSRQDFWWWLKYT